jgi:hypothetical protein
MCVLILVVLALYMCPHTSRVYTQYFSVWGRVTEAPNMSVSVCKCGAGSSRAAVQALVAALNYSILQVCMRP